MPTTSCPGNTKPLAWMVKRAVEWRPWAGARAHSAAALRHSRDGEGSPPGLRRCREQPRASGRAAGAAGAAWAEAAASEGSAGTVIHGSRAVWPCWLALMRDSTTLSAQQPQLTWSDRQGPWGEIVGGTARDSLSRMMTNLLRKSRHYLRLTILTTYNRPAYQQELMPHGHQGEVCDIERRPHSLGEG